MRTTSILISVLLTTVAAEKEKFRLSEDCVHKHPNHDAKNIPGTTLLIVFVDN